MKAGSISGQGQDVELLRTSAPAAADLNTLVQNDGCAISDLGRTCSYSHLSQTSYTARQPCAYMLVCTTILTHSISCNTSWQIATKPGMRMGISKQ